MITIDSSLAAWLMLAARICLSAVYLVSGVHKSIWYAEAAEEFRQARIPLVNVALPLTIALHLIAPICLILGVFVSEAAVALALFTLIATVLVHDFWNMEGAQRLDRSRVALANLGLIGGLLLLAAVGPGPLLQITVTS